MGGLDENNFLKDIRNMQLVTSGTVAVPFSDGKDLAESMMLRNTVH